MEEAWGNVSSGRISNVVPVLRSLTERPRTPSRRFSTSCTRARRRDQSTSSFSLGPRRHGRPREDEHHRGQRPSGERSLRFPYLVEPREMGQGNVRRHAREAGEELGHGQAQVRADDVAEDGEEQARPAPSPDDRSRRRAARRSTPPTQAWLAAPRKKRGARSSRTAANRKTRVHGDDDDPEEDELGMADDLPQVALRAHGGEQEVEAGVPERWRRRPPPGGRGA